MMNVLHNYQFHKLISKECDYLCLKLNINYFQNKIIEAIKASKNTDVVIIK